MSKNLESQIRHLEENIKPFLGSTEPPPFVDKDVKRLVKFVNDHCRLTSARDSAIVKRALLLLKSVYDWDFYVFRVHVDWPGYVRIARDGCPYLHSNTGENTGDSDDYDRPQLVSGGAFEMNRRRH